MRILERNITKNFLILFIFCIITFIMLCILIDLFNHLDDIFKQKIPLKIVAEYYLYFSPYIFSLIAPFASLFAIIFVLGSMNRNNEIIAIRSSGYSALKILKPIFFIALILGSITFVNDNLISPYSTHRQANIKKEYFEVDNINIDPEKTSLSVLHDLTLVGAQNRMYYAKSYDIKNKVLEKVIILEHNQIHQLVSKLTADRVEYTSKKWIGFNVSRINVEPSTGKILEDPKFYKKVALNIPEKPRIFALSYKSNVDFLNVKELYMQAVRTKTSQPKKSQNLMLEFYNRISTIFINLIVVMIAGAISLRYTQRKEMFMGLGVTLLIIVAYHLFTAITVTLVKGGILPTALGGCTSHVLFAIIGLSLLRKCR